MLQRPALVGFVLVVAVILSLYIGWWQQILSTSMVENLISTGIGIAFTVFFVDRLLRLRAAQAAERQWSPARRLFKWRLQRAVSNFVDAFGRLDGWGSKYVGAFQSDGPKKFAELVWARSRVAEMLLRAENVLNPDSENGRRLTKETAAFNRIHSEAVNHRAELLRRELEDFLLANLPGAFPPEMLNDALLAYNQTETFLEPSRVSDAYADRMTDEECNRPFLLAELLANVLSSLDPLWSWAVARENKEGVS